MAKRRNTKGPRDDVVTRFSRANHQRIQTLMALESDKKKLSLNELLERLLDTAETVKSSEVFYLFADQAYASVEEARGEAVMAAANSKSPITWPQIAIVIDQDTGV